MTIRVCWDNDSHTAVRWTLSDGWDWEDFAVAFHETDAMIRGLGRRVDLLADLSASPGLPGMTLSTYRAFMQDAAPELGVIVMVGVSTFIRAIVTAYETIESRRRPGSMIMLAGDLDEARAMLARRTAVYETLP